MKIVLTALLLFVLAFPAAASDVDDAVAVVKKTIPLAQQMDWAGFAQYLHPDALEEFATSMRPVIDGISRLMQEDTTGIEEFEQNFPGLLGLVREAEDAPPEEFFAATMQVIFSLVPNADQMFSSLETEVVGGLPEGDTLIHVVTRSKLHVGEITMDNQMDVMTCKKYGAEFRILLSGELKGLAEGLKQGMGM